MGTIFIAGTYGVGKSTLCSKLSTALKIPDFSAGDLISAVNGETYGANKAVRDKDANQNILASQVKQLLKSTPSIILAGHFCIFDINGNVGEISGIKYKLIGAVNKHADIFLVPEGENYEEAKKVKKEKGYDIDLVPVETFDEALKYLKNM